MVSAVGTQRFNDRESNKFYISPELRKKLKESHDHIIPNDPYTKSKILKHKLEDTLTYYIPKGITGNKNSNFYEFLTMGMVPYAIGSAMLMLIFNGVNKYLKPEQKNPLGTKVALGVVFYGLLKNIAPKLIEIPVHLKTGINPSMAYKKVITEFPEKEGEKGDKVFEYHNVFESVDFPRWDLLYNINNKSRNYYYNKIAAKNSLGKNLPDSDQEVKPRIKEIIIKTKTASTISSYIWAALGVGIAMQSNWDGLLTATKREKTKIFSKTFATRFINTFADSISAVYNGGKFPTLAKKVAGRALVIGAVGSTVIGAINAMYKFDKEIPDIKLSKIDYDNKYTVG